MEIKVLDFTGKWCSTCQVIDKMIADEVIPKYKNKVQFIKVDVEEDEDWCNKYDILSVPTLIILVDGKEIWRRSGTISKNEVIKKLAELTQWKHQLD